MVEAIYCLRDDRKESSSSGSEGPKAMLPARERNRRRSDVREKETLKNFDCRGEKRDRTIRGAKMGGFSRFRDRDDMGSLPNRGDVSIRNREVKELS